MVRAYVEVARSSFRRHSSYRAATFAGAFTNSVFGVIRAAILVAVWEAKPVIGGYDVRDAVTYVFLGQALLAAMAIWGGSTDLVQRVRSGDVAVDLLRPLDFQTYWLADDLGRAGYVLVARGLPPLLVGAVLFDLRLPTDPQTWALFVMTVLLGLVVSFGVRYLVSLSAFWLIDSEGVASSVFTASMFFSGLILPLVLFPGWLGDLARALPFAAYIQVPSDVLLGKATTTALATSLLWAVALWAAGRVVTSAATRKLVVQGG